MEEATLAVLEGQMAGLLALERVPRGAALQLLRHEAMWEWYGRTFSDCLSVCPAVRPCVARSFARSPPEAMSAWKWPFRAQVCGDDDRRQGQRHGGGRRDALRGVPRGGEGWH